MALNGTYKRNICFNALLLDGVSQHKVKLGLK